MHHVAVDLKTFEQRGDDVVSNNTKNCTFAQVLFKPIHSFTVTARTFEFHLYSSVGCVVVCIVRMTVVYIGA